jgi:hypothetical protein
MRGVKAKDAPFLSAPPKVTLEKKRRKDIKPDKTTGKVFYLSPTTLKPLKRTTKADVLFAYKNLKGKVHILHPESQPPSKKIKNWVQKHIDKTGETFALYRKRSKEVFLDKDGKRKKHRKRRASDPVKYVHKTRLAVPSTREKQQGVLYRGGRRVRTIDRGFYKHSREKLLTQVITPIKTTGKVVQLSLQGETIYESMNQLVLDQSMRRLKPYEKVYYEWIMIYRDPRTGEKITVPGAGSDRPPHDHSIISPLHVGTSFGEMPRVVGSHVRVGNIVLQIATSIRMGLANHGVRFTSLAKLKELDNELAQEMEKMEDPIKLEKARLKKTRTKFVGLKRNALEMTPIFAEDAQGNRVGRAGKNMVRISLRLTIEEDPTKKREWQSKQRRKK